MRANQVACVFILYPVLLQCFRFGVTDQPHVSAEVEAEKPAAELARLAPKSTSDNEEDLEAEVNRDKQRQWIDGQRPAPKSTIDNEEDLEAEVNRDKQRQWIDGINPNEKPSLALSVAEHDNIVPSDTEDGEAFFTPRELDEDERVKAATKIQAVHRGNAARKDMAQKVEQENAATKIQAVHRGNAARKEMGLQALPDPIPETPRELPPMPPPSPRKEEQKVSAPAPKPKVAYDLHKNSACAKTENTRDFISGWQGRLDGENCRELCSGRPWCRGYILGRGLCRLLAPWGGSTPQQERQWSFQGSWAEPSKWEETNQDMIHGSTKTYGANNPYKCFRKI